MSKKSSFRQERQAKKRLGRSKAQRAEGSMETGRLKKKDKIPNPDRNPTKNKAPVREPGEKVPMTLDEKASTNPDVQPNPARLPANVGGKSSIGVPTPKRKRSAA